MPGFIHGCQYSVLTLTYCKVIINYFPFLLGHVLPMPYYTYTTCKFCRAFFSSPLCLFGRDFIPCILVVIILFWGICLVLFLITSLVGLSLLFHFVL